MSRFREGWGKGSTFPRIFSFSFFLFPFFFPSLRLDLLTRVEKGFFPLKEKMIGVWKGVWKNGGGRSVERTFLPSIGARRRNRGKSCVEIGGGGKKGNGEGLVRFDRGNFSKRKGNLCRDKSKAKLLNLLIEFFFSNLPSFSAFSCIINKTSTKWNLSRFELE